MNQSLSLFLMAFLCLSLCAKPAWAQTPSPQPTLPDTVMVEQDTLDLEDDGLISTTQLNGTSMSDTIMITSGDVERKIPKKAALYAAALPGLGQAYNGSYWKIPIVYATFIGLGWVATLHNDRYQLFQRAKTALANNVPELNPLREAPNGTNPRTVDILLDDARRDRDYFYILMAGAYALQIMEAITDAHLIEFDVNEELSLEFRPSAGQLMAYASQASFVPATGLSLLIKLK